MITRIRKRLRTIRDRSRYERELDLELQFHLDMLTAQHQRSGLSPALARRAALRAFGPMAGVKDDVRDTWLARIVESALQDVRYGVRMLATAPAFALGMILTIALAIGVNTSIFGIAYALLLRPLPFDRSADLIVLQHGTPDVTRITFSPRSSTTTAARVASTRSPKCTRCGSSFSAHVKMASLHSSPSEFRPVWYRRTTSRCSACARRTDAR